MSNTAKLVISLALILGLALFIYQSDKQQKEADKKKDAATQDNEECTVIDGADFEQRKTDYYWDARHLGSYEQEQIINVYERPGDPNHFDAFWRWAYDQVIKDGFCTPKDMA